MPYRSTRVRPPAHRWLPLWRGALRGRRATDFGRVLPLHPLSASDGDRRLGAGPHRTGFAARARRRGRRSLLRSSRRLLEGVLLPLWVCTVEQGSRRFGRDQRPSRRIRLRSRHQTRIPPVRRVRRRLGAAPRGRAAAVPEPAPCRHPLTAPWCDPAAGRPATVNSGRRCRRSDGNEVLWLCAPRPFFVLHIERETSHASNRERSDSRRRSNRAS